MHHVVAGAVDASLCTDAVHDRVAHVDVGRGHVDLGAERRVAVGELAGAHAARVRFSSTGAVAERAVCGRAQSIVPRYWRISSAVQVADVGLARFDQLDRPSRKAAQSSPRRRTAGASQSKPSQSDVGVDGVDVLLLFFRRVGVVEPQVAAAVELAGDAEVEADGLGVADVEVAVGFGREAGDDVPPSGRGDPRRRSRG